MHLIILIAEKLADVRSRVTTTSKLTIYIYKFTKLVFAQAV